MVNAQKFEKNNTKRDAEYAARVLAGCAEVKTYKLSDAELMQYAKLKSDPDEAKPSTLIKVTSMTKGIQSNVMRKSNCKVNAI